MDIRTLIACLSCLLVPALAQAQSFPAKPVTIVLPFAAGGGMDHFLRPLAQRYSELWGRPVVVDYRPGASSIIGTEYVIKSAPDGHTLLASSSSLVLNPHLRKLPYDTWKDLAPVSGYIRDAYGIALTNSVPASSMKELIELAKAKPGVLSYASVGVGTTAHLVVEMMQSAAGIKLNHVPYKGAGAPLMDVAAGHVDMMLVNVGSIAPHWKAGRLKMIAITAAKRSALYPTVPTVAEAVPGFEAQSWWGLHAPAGTPRSVVDKINADTRKTLLDPGFRAKNLDIQGYEPILLTAEQFTDFLKSEYAMWGTVVRDAKVPLE